MFKLEFVLFLVILPILLRIFLRFGVLICKSREQLFGKTVIITGANSGLGYHVAKDLAKRGARVILGCRNESRGMAARDQIISATGNTQVIYKNIDLGSLASVRRFCADILGSEKRLDVLVNNAGVFGFGDRYTEDGIVEGMQINYFGAFLLTELLLPLLQKSKPSRIVNVSSLAHYFGNINVDNINRKGYYGDSLTYANSKLCNAVYTLNLAERLEGSEVTVNAVHPGVIRTNLLDNQTNFIVNVFLEVFRWVCYRSVEEGAQTIIAACLEQETGNFTGKFLVDGSRWPYSWRCSKKSVRTGLQKISEELCLTKVDR